MACGRENASASVGDYGPDRLAFMHQVEAFVDSFEGQHVRDQIVDVDLAVHVPVDDPGHIGAATCAAKRRAFPDPAGDELERPRFDLLASAGDADDHRHAPAAVAALQSLAHHLDIADAFETIVGAAARELHQIRYEIALDLLWIDEMRHAELAGQRLAPRIQVDADDHVGADHARTLHDVEADAAQPEDDDVGAGLHLGGVNDRADAGGDAAADIADLVEGRVVADFRDRDFG